MDTPEKTYNQIAGQKTQRIEALSDGVFAIAMTLLILDLKVPVSEAIHTEADLARAFCALTPKLLSYFMGFTTLGIFWVGQTTQYGFIEKSDRHLSWLALFFLMCVSLVPFTTAFLSEYITFKFSILIYWANIFVLGLSTIAHWKYAYNHDLLTGEQATLAVADKAVTKRVVIAQTLYATGALLCFINIYLSIVVIILIQMNYAFAPFQNVGAKRAARKKNLPSQP